MVARTHAHLLCWLCAVLCCAVLWRCRPCHYVAIDVKRGNIVLGVRGSLELGDLETDVTAAPLPYEFQVWTANVTHARLHVLAMVCRSTPLPACCCLRVGPTLQTTCLPSGMPVSALTCLFSS
jgi:hypothetical protein